MEYGQSDLNQNYLCRRLKGHDHSIYLCGEDKEERINNGRLTAILVNE